MATDPIRVRPVGIPPSGDPAINRWMLDVTAALNRVLEEIVLLREAVNTLGGP